MLSQHLNTVFLLVKIPIHVKCEAQSMVVHGLVYQLMKLDTFSSYDLRVGKGCPANEVLLDRLGGGLM